MKTFCKLLFGAALLPASISAQQNTDSIVASWERMLDLDEVVVVAQRPVIKNESDRIVYLIKNDPYAKGLNGLEVLDRIPRVSVVNEQVTVAGKSQVRYIVDGRLLDMPEDAIASRLRNLTASGIDKIEVLTTPPAKYAAGQNVAFVSITTRNESLGTRGNAWSNATVPENFINSNKTGLYASYFRSLFDWWNVKLEGELFYSYAKSKIADFRNINDDGWSGKLELNSSWMLNRQKTLILNLRFSHYFPYHDRMIHYESMSLIGCDIRYMLLDNRLTLSASVSDPFGWNITKSNAFYNDFNVTTCNNIHSHAVSFRISYSFGSNKAGNVYRDTKERESQRSY